MRRVYPECQLVRAAKGLDGAGREPVDRKLLVVLRPVIGGNRSGHSNRINKAVDIIRRDVALVAHEIRVGFRRPAIVEHVLDFAEDAGLGGRGASTNL